jgi:hypothetical protein
MCAPSVNIFMHIIEAMPQRAIKKLCTLSVNISMHIIEAMPQRAVKETES